MCRSFFVYVRGGVLFVAVLWMSGFLSGSCHGQKSRLQFGNKVPADVEHIYEKGLQWLARAQAENGSWSHSGNTSGQSGIDGLCLMAFFAAGEDPNFGRYAETMRKGIRHLILSQNSHSGYFPNSMYNHGFAMLALCEAYGFVDEEMLWDGIDNPRRRTLGEALHLAVRCAVTSQAQNPARSWRYSPNSKDADTSVCGAVLMGLLAARNAGIKVPDQSIDDALKYIKQATSKRGNVSYMHGFGGGLFGSGANLPAIATLVFAIGNREHWKEYDATKKRIASLVTAKSSSHPFYGRYYMAQALFQSDFGAWLQWNTKNVRVIRRMQGKEGSIGDSPHGKAYGTAMSLLALGLNYRLLPIYER